MIKSIDKSAKTVELAIEQALAELGVGPDEAVIEVLDEGEAGGLLGFGRRPALVRASVEVEDAEVEEKVSSPEKAAVSEHFVDADFEETKVRRGDAPQKLSPEAYEVEKNMAEDVAVDFVANILQSLDIHGRISSYFDDEGTLKIDVDGQDIGNAIGRRGETMDAIQYLAGLAVNRKTEEYYRLTLDIGQYRERHLRGLRQNATRAASRVLRSGRRMALEAMTPAERRQVHMVLADFEGVVTYSEGDEPNRRVVIAPADEKRR